MDAANDFLWNNALRVCVLFGLLGLMFWRVSTNDELVDPSTGAAFVALGLTVFQLLQALFVPALIGLEGRAGLFLSVCWALGALMMPIVVGVLFGGQTWTGGVVLVLVLATLVVVFRRTNVEWSLRIR